LILPVEVPPLSVEAMMPVEFVTTIQMGEKGQVTVPKRYRDALKLETGAPMVVVRLGAGLLLIPEQARFRQLCDRIADIFTSHGVTAAELLASLPEARKRVFESQYPELAKAEKARTRNPRKRKTVSFRYAVPIQREQHESAACSETSLFTGRTPKDRRSRRQTYGIQRS
jgi:bifunctional DNA-binding transcriptional regulator/antitoxin component of YhaV-PrlF toxin-antitoxin module